MQRPVVETVERDEVYTVNVPVTTYQNVTTDQGGYVDQQNVTPGRVVTRMQWVPGSCVTDPLHRNHHRDASRADVGTAEAARPGHRHALPGGRTT